MKKLVAGKTSGAEMVALAGNVIVAALYVGVGNSVLLCGCFFGGLFGVGSRIL